MDDEPQTRPYVVACDTEGCKNNGWQLTVEATPENPTIICGPCGQAMVPQPSTEV